MNPTHYEIRNWREFQHYKQRNPPWIKFHYDILTSRDWVMLADASKLVAVVCMLLASRNGGKIPNDPDYIARAGHLKCCDLKPLEDSGFLVPLAGASDCLQMLADASTKKSREEERREDKTACGPIVMYLNLKAGTSYRPTSAATRRLVGARLNDGFTEADFRTVIDAKVSDWRDDPKMAKFLRPETLFGTKFEGYLQTAKVTAPRPAAEATRNLDEEVWREENCDEDGNLLTAEQKAERAEQKARDLEEIKNGWLEKELAARARQAGGPGV